MKGPGQKSPAKAIGDGKYMEGFKKMTTKQLFDVVKRNDRGLESGRKEIVKRTQERGDANSIYQAMTANDSTNAAKRVIRHRIQKGTFDDGSLKKGENPFKMKGFGGFGEGTSPAKQKYKLGNVTGDAQDDRQANKESQMSYTKEYANKALKQLVSDEKAIQSGKFNLKTDPDGKNKKGQDNYSDIQDRRYENKNVVRAYRDQQKNVKAGKDSTGKSIAKKKKKGESSLDYNRRVKGVNRGGRPGNYKGPKTPQVGKTVKGSRRKIV